MKLNGLANVKQILDAIEKGEIVQFSIEKGIWESYTIFDVVELEYAIRTGTEIRIKPKLKDELNILDNKVCTLLSFITSNELLKEDSVIRNKLIDVRNVISLRLEDEKL